MTKRTFHIICSLLLTAAGLRAQSVSSDSIRFSGASFYNRAQLLASWNIQNGSVLRNDFLGGCLALTEKYRRAGYYRAGCLAEFGTDSSSVLVLITEGPRYLPEEIVFDGNNYLSSAFLQSLVATGRNEVLDSVVMVRDMEAISLAYADHGFPQAEISVKELRAVGGRLAVTYGINENARVTLGRVMYRGNLVTGERTMQRLSGLWPDSPFSRTALEAALKNLTNSGLFSQISSPRLMTGQEPGRQDVLISVKEARFNRIFGAASYVQPSTDQKGWLAGSFDLSLGNIAGTARSATVSWERPQKENSRLEVGYYEPFLFGYVLSADIGLKHMVEDSSYVKTSAGLLVKMPMGEGFKAGAGADYERIVPGSAMIYQRCDKYSTKWLLEWRKTGEAAFPLNGLLRLEADYGRKRYYQPSQQLTVSKLSWDITVYEDIFTRQEAYIAVKIRTVITGEKPVPRYDQFAMGGTASLRGYYQDQFIASQVAWVNLEYRYKPVESFVLFPFTDLGYFFDRERGLRGYRTGYGFGFKLDTRIGWINIIYGLGQDDSILNGKVHFGLESVF